LASPVDRLGGGGVEPVQRTIRGAVFVVVAFDDRDVHRPDHIQAFLWIRIIADDISQAGDMGAFLLFDVLQHDLQRLAIGVNIGYDGLLHEPYATISNPRNTFSASPHRKSSFWIKCSSSDWRIVWRKASNSSWLPSASNSTRPSGKLRTAPVTSKPLASLLTA